jgi:membrane associated rhomboid family serine protease
MDPGLPPPPLKESCYRHPDEPTLVHCTRCGRPICPRCMIQAPVGHQCPECAGRTGWGNAARGSGLRIAGSGISVTRVILAILLAVFVVEVAIGGPSSLLLGPTGSQLVRLGASAPILIAEGQWWRMLSAIFLHAGIIHIALNGYALWIFGTVTERDFGRPAFAALFIVTGFAGSVASFLFAPLTPAGLTTVGVGASGAIFGLLGAFTAFYFRRRNTASGRYLLQQAIFLIVINLVIGFSIHFIDVHAHIGGLIAGIACGAILDPQGPARQWPALKWVGLLAIVVACGVVTYAHVQTIRALVG